MKRTAYFALEREGRHRIDDEIHFNALPVRSVRLSTPVPIYELDAVSTYCIFDRVFDSAKQTLSPGQ